MFLVEHYRPGLSAERLAAAAADVRAASAALAAAGRPIAYLRSTIVPGDEAYLSLFEAGSEEDIRAAYARAGIPYERISAAVAAEPDQEETR